MFIKDVYFWYDNKSEKISRNSIHKPTNPQPMSGVFEGILILYKKEDGVHYISSKDQASQILNKAQSLISDGAPGVAITYSANYGQTVKINQTYKDGNWNTQTSGANQADVMQSMESLLGGDFSNLQHKMRIAPITTMTYTDYGGGKHEDVIKNDLANIKSLLDLGWTVLGWQNEDTGINDFAVGGGVAKKTGQFPKDLSNLVQTTLKKYLAEYPVG
jgi:hypothetical protein